MLAMGLVAERAESDRRLELWPENELPVAVFARMGTQWNVGQGGTPVGLRYEALPVVFGMCGVTRKKQARVFEALRIMEREALRAISEE